MKIDENKGYLNGFQPLTPFKIGLLSLLGEAPTAGRLEALAPRAASAAGGAGAGVGAGLGEGLENHPYTSISIYIVYI